jgi:hypothetical protein
MALRDLFGLIHLVGTKPTKRCKGIFVCGTPYALHAKHQTVTRTGKPPTCLYCVAGVRCR